MNYCDLFSECHIAVISDWLDIGKGLFVHFEIPHSGGNGYSYRLTSIEQLHELVSKQKSNELEIFIFRKLIDDDDELDEKLEIQWIYNHPDEVLYCSVKKNRGHYEPYQQDSDRYQEAIENWRRLSR